MYLVLGAAGSGRREVLADLIEGGLAEGDRPAVLVADLDLDQRRDWLELFPFLSTRRPDAYSLLTAPRS